MAGEQNFYVVFGQGKMTNFWLVWKYFAEVPAVVKRLKKTLKKVVLNILITFDYVINMTLVIMVQVVKRSSLELATHVQFPIKSIFGKNMVNEKIRLLLFIQFYCILFIII